MQRFPNKSMQYTEKLGSHANSGLTSHKKEVEYNKLFFYYVLTLLSSVMIFDTIAYLIIHVIPNIIKLYV